MTHLGRDTAVTQTGGLAAPESRPLATTCLWREAAPVPWLTSSHRVVGGDICVGAPRAGPMGNTQSAWDARWGAGASPAGASESAVLPRGTWSWPHRRKEGAPAYAEATGLFTRVPSYHVYSNRELGIISTFQRRRLRLRRVYVLGFCQLQATDKPTPSGLNDKDIYLTNPPKF